jgi:hypothetical protein
VFISEKGDYYIYYYLSSYSKVSKILVRAFSLIFLILYLPEDPAFSTGVDPFSNANIYVLDQLIGETKTDLESTTCLLLSPILH